MAQQAHDLFKQVVEKMRPGQKVGAIRNLKVEQKGHDLVVTYAFDWRGIDEAVLADERQVDQVCGLAERTLEQLPWDDPPSITISPNLVADKPEFVATLAW